jgi:8-oxo-dGTP pyrophosphatase MutT (NUDIX family)
MLDTLVTVPGQQRIPRPLSYRPGAPAPWVSIPAERRRLTLAMVRERLAGFEPDDAPAPRITGSVAAAVLIPLYDADDGAHVILIKRPETMPSHRGEIAFPGGKFEGAQDADLEQTALREAHEEIGLKPSDVEVVARLASMATVASRFTITPFVGFLTARPTLTPSPSEVTRVLDVPLAALLADDVYREELWDVGASGLGVHFYELEDETVWGATARMLTRLLAHLMATG